MATGNDTRQSELQILGAFPEQFERGAIQFDYNSTAPVFVKAVDGSDTNFLITKTSRRSQVYPCSSKGDRTESISPAMVKYSFNDYRRPSIPNPELYRNNVFSVTVLGDLYGRCGPGSYPFANSSLGPTPATLTTLDRTGRAYNLAVYDMQGKIANRASSLVSIIEAKKTMGMLTQTSGIIYRAMKAVRKGQFKKAATELGLKAIPKKTSRRKQLADNWLAYRYGWLPLYLDMYSHATAIYDSAHKPMHFRVSGDGEEEISLTGLETTVGAKYFANSVQLNGIFAGQGSKYTYTVPHVVKRKYLADTKKIKVGCIFEITDASAFTAANFGVDNPLNVAWEVVPLSFVVDWFYNIGDWLTQLTAYRGLSFRDGFVKVESKTFIRDRLSNDITDPGNQNRLSYLAIGEQIFCYHRENRTRLTSLPYAQIVASNPLQVFSDMIGLKRFGDSVSLLSGQVKGYKRGNLRI